jgi:hypothetical protein
VKRPSIQFYPADWLQEAGLRACSLASRGLWIEVMCLMHQASPYGHLTLATRKDGGEDTLQPILPGVLARMVGSSEGEVANCLEELERFGVFSRTPGGVIFSRRMVRDEKVRESRAAGGFESLKHPKVPTRKDGGKDPSQGSLGVSFRGSSEGSLGGSPSSSSSSSSSKKKKGALVYPDWVPRNEVEEWLAMRATQGKPIKTQHAFDLAMTNLAEVCATGEDPRDVVNRAILGCWVHFYPKDQRHAPPTGSTSRKQAAEEPKLFEKASNLIPLKDVTEMRKKAVQ